MNGHGLLLEEYMVVSQIRGPQSRPQYTIVLIIGPPPKKVPLIVGNPHISTKLNYNRTFRAPTRTLGMELAQVLHKITRVGPRGSKRESILPGPQKVCKRMAFMAIIMSLGLLFYILLGFR